MPVLKFALGCEIQHVVLHRQQLCTSTCVQAGQLEKFDISLARCYGYNKRHKTAA